MKVMILTDLEGPSGVNGRADSIGNTMLNIPTACQALVNEVNACCDGLFAAGATQVDVEDGHGGSNSIDIFKLHPRARLIQVGRWWPATFLDSTYDAFVQLGAHGMQSSGGYMCHTFNSHGVCGMVFNGKPIGEIGICAYRAAYFKIPTILVSGDEVACQETRELLGDKVATVATKAAAHRYAVMNYPPEEVYKELREKSEQALRNLKKMPCLKMPKHCELVVTAMCPNHVDQYEMMGIERPEPNVIRFASDDFIEIWAQRLGWAPGVHQKKFGVTPKWIHPNNRVK